MTKISKVRHHTDELRERFIERIRRLLGIGKRQTPEEMFAQWL